MSTTVKSPGKSAEKVSVASDRTRSSATPIVPAAIIYTPSCTRNSFMKNAATKHSKNNNNKSIVQRLTAAEQTSDLCSAISVTPSDGRQSDRRSSGEEEGSPFNSASTIDFRSKKTPPSPILPSSTHPSSVDGSFNIRSRNPVTDFRNYRSFDSSQLLSNDTNSNSTVEPEPFYPLVRPPPPGAFNESANHYTFEHIFHWSENIENRSPWVRQRTKEITDHVNGLFETRKHEISENDSENVIFSQRSKPGTAHQNNSETDDDDDDDGITYEMASALCHSLIGRDETDSSENQCSSNELKWTRLYRNLVNYGQL